MESVHGQVRTELGEQLTPEKTTGAWRITSPPVGFPMPPRRRIFVELVRIFDVHAT